MAKPICENLRQPDEKTLKRLYPASLGDTAERLALHLIEDPSPYYPKRGSSAGEKRIAKSRIYTALCENWDYQKALSWTREEFVSVTDTGEYRYPRFDRYRSSKSSYRSVVEKKDQMDREKEQLFRMNPAALTSEVSRLMRMGGVSQKGKERLASDLVVSYLKTIQFQTVRNDLIEYLFFLNHPEVFPTLVDISGVDYFVDGIPFDQKVSFGLGAPFVKDFESEDAAWITAFQDKDELCKSLFQNQDLDRVKEGVPNNRVYVVLKDIFTGLEELDFAVRVLDLSKPKLVTAIHPTSGKSVDFFNICTIIQ